MASIVQSARSAPSLIMAADSRPHKEAVPGRSSTIAGANKAAHGGSSWTSAPPASVAALPDRPLSGQQAIAEGRLRRPMLEACSRRTGPDGGGQRVRRIRDRLSRSKIRLRLTAGCAHPAFYCWHRAHRTSPMGGAPHIARVAPHGSRARRLRTSAFGTVSDLARGASWRLISFRRSPEQKRSPLESAPCPVTGNHHSRAA